MELQQSSQTEKLSKLDQQGPRTTFKSKLMKTNWIVHARSDGACHSAQLVQVIKNKFDVCQIKGLKIIVDHLQTIPNVSIKQYGLDKNMLYIHVYSDGSFANNADLSS